MKLNIGIVYGRGGRLNVAELSEAFAGRCKLTALEYDSFAQLERLLEGLRGLDGALFDSDLALRYLVLRGALGNLPHGVAASGEAEVLRALVACRQDDPALELSRVLVDVGSGGLFEDLFSIERRPVFISQDVWSGGDPTVWEDGTLRRYQTAWGSGLFDLILTRRVSLLERLESLGITARGVRAAPESAARALEGVLSAALEKTLRETLPVCCVVGTRGGTQALEPLGRALGRFCDEQGHSLTLARRAGLFEMETSNRLLLELTAEYSECRLLEYLKYHLDDTVCIGWGVGADILRARENAVRAYRESLFDRRNHSYIVDEEGGVLGPLAGRGGGQPRDRSRPVTARIEAAAAAAGISPGGLMRVLDLLDHMDTELITSERLAFHLGIARRSAARLLARLEAGGVAQLCETGLAGARGRPAKRYRILL